MKRHEQALNHSKSAIMIVQESLLKAFLPKIENQEEDKKLYQGFLIFKAGEENSHMME
jgi:bifunctional N-acetylglucosamine-1-phosphate-uridyltransferase/glucosamine-1-phosphate-acetyltransferase GlmU-like protein